MRIIDYINGMRSVNGIKDIAPLLKLTKAHHGMSLVILMVFFSFLVPHISLQVKAQGLPRIHNYSAEEYGGHNRNYDIEIGEDGTVFVANFENLLYYDRARWRKINTPNLSRATVVYRASDNNVWVGGYNFFGLLKRQANGSLTIQRMGGNDLFKGEVLEIFESDGTLQFVATDNNIYEVKGNTVKLKQHAKTDFHVSMESSIVRVEALQEGQSNVLKDSITQEEVVGDDLVVRVRKNNGLSIADAKGHELYTITEADGLCSNQVSYVAYDGHGLLWGATAHGVFSIEMSSPYSYLLQKDGLTGEVHDITEFNGKIYVASSNGVFRIDQKPVQLISDAICWGFSEGDYGLFVATSDGIYLIERNGTIKRVVANATTALYVEKGKIWAGEHNSVYYYERGKEPLIISEVDKVTKILKDAQKTLWLQNVYGEIWQKKSNESAFKPYYNDTTKRVPATIVNLDGKAVVISALDEKPIAYPAYATSDETGTTWLTDKNGLNLYKWKNGKPQRDLDHLLRPLADLNVGALYVSGHKVWIGGDEILVSIDTDKKDLDSLTANPRLLFRQIVMGSDSVLWGGFGDMPKSLEQLDSDERNLRISYALDYAPLTGKTHYRYRLNDDKWSAWSEKQETEFLNLPYGSYTLSIQARLANGELSEVTSVKFSIAFPVLMRWYMLLFYFVLLVLAVFAIMRIRLRRLRQEKIKLEKIVQERTSEVVKQRDEIVKQKDEIEVKSKSLEKALDDLNNAQNELIRQEKMASVGKLTEGLIDRILNPMNYIINFSKMSNDLLKDLKDNIENNKDKIDEDDYADTEDVLDMLSENLKSVDQYGQNTTRTLKAMEEMLKDRTGGYIDMDLQPLLQQNEKMLNTYFEKDKEQYHIKMVFSIPDTPMMLNGNPDMLSKTIMSLLGNSVYAVVKKAQKTKFEPEVSLTAVESDGQYLLKVRDNGIGIEEKILGKIFDPFFTTKTTNEAAGIGLYLSREIIQNHKGDIFVNSVKDEFTEFTIKLPVLKTENSN